MALSEEDLTQITGVVQDKINGVIGNLKKTFDLGRQKDSEALKGDVQKMFDALTEKLAAGGGAGEGGDADTGKGGKGGKGGESARELATLRQQVQETARRLDESQKQAQAERDKNRSAALRNAISETLEPLGITGIRFKSAYALLQQEGRIRYAADDSDDISYVDAAGEVDYRTGLAGWVKSDDAKIFLPPSGSQGAGTRPRSGQPQMKSGPLTDAERSQKMNEAMAAWAENPTGNR